ncbi:hypothetical protein U1Q18_000356 [Sarracenia purpurea var. burkii]
MKFLTPPPCVTWEEKCGGGGWGHFMHFLIFFFILHYFLFQIYQDKHKANTNSMKHQPPLNKVAREVITKDTQGATGGFSAAVMDSDVALSSISRQLTNESTSGVGGRRERVGSLPPKISTTLAQTWKEDIDAGHLLPLLFEYFGESLFSFIPTPELSYFL